MKKAKCLGSIVDDWTSTSIQSTSIGLIVRNYSFPQSRIGWVKRSEPNIAMFWWARSTSHNRHNRFLCQIHWQHFQIWEAHSTLWLFRMQENITYDYCKTWLYRNFHFIYTAYMAYAMNKSPLDFVVSAQSNEKGAKGVVNLSSWTSSS